MERKGYLIIHERQIHYVVTLKDNTIIDKTMTQRELQKMMKEYVVIGIKRK